jgi:predicted Zn finger-like uncharacterized protein
MIIECPSCGARAKLPESKEGAKVRCTECERVYVARSSTSGGKSSRSQSSAAMPIGIGAGVLALVMILLMVSNKDTPQNTGIDTPDVPEAPRNVADDVGWDSVMVRFTRSLHTAAYARDRAKLQSVLALDHIWARLQSTDEETVDPAGFAELGTTEMNELRDEALDSLLLDDPENLVASWTPFDGSVISEGDTLGVVRLMLQPASDNTATGSRNIEWKLIRDGSDWKVWSWERWYSAAELKKRSTKKRKTKTTTLSDGSIVIEGEPGPIPYMDSTPPEERKHIDRLIEKLIDIELPGAELRKVKAELRLAGKDAVPPLLTRFYEMNLAGFPDLDSAIQAALVNEILGDITGHITTFKAHTALGATIERRDSGVRQWFGWYRKDFDKFEGLELLPDLLEETIELKTDAERREYEKMKRLIEQEEKDQRAREEREKLKNDG